ncbi:EcsC family protein [Runella sp. MFBS21]|uniref:EcsC family protein n=1 Tax=Runella sp. MFBS21 TaxID=3034018 RepID=UPI0023F9D66D|nr:EcsC family protein [Runella sp. MFBS21]MDF7816642.1 EcsC family protein [Runella sp. MFBS21]
MTPYEQLALKELKQWQRQMLRKPSAANRLAKSIQTWVNNLIPEKIHEVITTTIKQMTRAVLFGAEFITPQPSPAPTFELREAAVFKRISFYKTAGAAEGGVAGAGGFLLAIADFPLLLSIKLKLLFDIAAQYGYPIDDYRERVYILHIFQLAFSSQQRRKEVYLQMVDWEHKSKLLPEDIHAFDWRQFQQEYRDYIDLAKMAQLIPGIGAAVGVVVNYRLIDKLGKTAMNAYRMRWEETTKKLT